jgi:hypothetical protein
VWLIAVTGIMAFALLSFDSQQNTIQDQADTIQKQQRRLTRIAHQNRALNRQLCGVVINSHTASLARLRSERRRLRLSLDYLRDPTSMAENPSLFARVRTGVAASRDDVHAARLSAMATRPPERCLQAVGAVRPSGDTTRQ